MIGRDWQFRINRPLAPFVVNARDAVRLPSESLKNPFCVARAFTMPRV